MTTHRWIRWLTVFILGLGISLPAAARPWSEAAVEIDILDDSGRELRQFPVDSNHPRKSVTRAYVEAEREANYSIRVRNNTARRIGVVIAVDGRNIISGKSSQLSSNERMYILRPHATQTYDGWRSSGNQVHRFYFTDSADSYAENTFSDHSAMGVIAVAAYAERKTHSPAEIADAPALNRSKRQPQGYNANEGAAQPGTGFGDSHWSPSVRVEFDAEDWPLSKHFFKYEWRRTLCRMGIIRCQRPRPPSHNRFWPDDGWNDDYAPYPPGYRR
jgi:hypothetical protein